MGRGRMGWECLQPQCESSHPSEDNGLWLGEPYRAPRAGTPAPGSQLAWPLPPVGGGSQQEVPSNGWGSTAGNSLGTERSAGLLLGNSHWAALLAPHVEVEEALQETTHLRSLEQLRIASGVLQHQEGMEVSHPCGWTGNKEGQHHQKGLDRKGDTRMAMLMKGDRQYENNKNEGTMGQWGLQHTRRR